MDANPTAAQVPEAAPQGELIPKLRKVFISYASPDRKFALRLTDSLRKNGIDAWIADHNIDAGTVWSRKLDEALKASGAVVLVVSPDSRKSDDVDKELQGAKDYGVEVVPVLHRECESWYRIRNLQRIDFTLSYEEGFAKLMKWTPAPRPWWREILIFIKRNRIHFYVIAAVIAAFVAVYYLLPSDTSFVLSGGDASGLVVDVRNRGGQSSTLASDSFVLHFGRLPIHPQKLVLEDPHRKSRIPGHSVVRVRLKSPTMLTPRAYPDKPYFFYDKVEVMPLLAKATVTLRGEIEESNDRRKTWSHSTKAENSRTFIYQIFPGVVPRAPIAP